MKAGSSIPVKFSLGGACDAATAPAGTPTASAGASRLAYDVAIDQYIYVWKT